MLTESLCTASAETGAADFSHSKGDEVQRRLRMAGENIMHQVKPADSLFKIARHYGVSYAAVARANKISNPNLIFSEQKLIIPRKTIVPRVLERGMVINIPEFRLYLFEGGMLTDIFPVSVGLPTWQTPVGEFTIANKVKDPAWYMPPEMAEKENVKREIIPAGPDNPLGDRWIGTSIKHTGIHGTNQPMSIGRALSHGCVRLYPENIQRLFEKVEVGDPGVFVYEPVKISATEGEILIEVHPDVYSLASDIEGLVRKKLEELNLLDKADPEKLKRALSELLGVPVCISK